jgi:hypothetical protein
MHDIGDLILVDQIRQPEVTGPTKSQPTTRTEIFVRVEVVEMKIRDRIKEMRVQALGCCGYGAGMNPSCVAATMERWSLLGLTPVSVK